MKKTAFLLMAVCFLPSISAFSQDQAEARKDWNFKVEPYLMAPYMNGKVAVGILPSADIDVDASDVFERLKGAFMLYGEANNGQWAITADFVYMNLQETLEPGEQINSGELNFKETIFGMEGLYRILPWLEFGVGGRFVSMGGDMKISWTGVGPNGQTNVQQAELSESWFDPTLLFRMQIPNSGKWIGELKADVGGFGIGSQETYQVQVSGGYRFSKLFQATAGYRALSIDYESKAGGSGRFNYDVKTTGPVVRLGFNF